MNGYVILVIVIASFLILLTIWTDRRKKKLDEIIRNNQDVSVVILTNRHRINDNYAKENTVTEVDGNKADIFSFKPGVHAICVTPGKHTLKAKSTWVIREDSKRTLKNVLGPVDVDIVTLAKKFYSLNYNIRNKDYEFIECDPNNLFD